MNNASTHGDDEWPTGKDIVKIAEIVVGDYPGDRMCAYIKQVRHAAVEQARSELLEELAAKADWEYSRQEIDNWTFSLGALTHEALLTVKGKAGDAS